MTTGVLTALFTGVIAVLTFLLWRIEWRMTVLTGALASHSLLMVRLQAAEQDIPVIWWDKTIKDWPFDGKHGEPAELQAIWIGVPWAHRRKKPSKVVKLLRGDL